MTVDRTELRRKAQAAYGTRRRPASPSEVLALLDRLDTYQEAADLVRRFRSWDDLPGRADGPYWIREADRVLAALDTEQP